MFNLNMRVFHNQLFQRSEVHDPQMKSLCQLTQATSTQMKALNSTLGWTDWGVKAA